MSSLRVTQGMVSGVDYEEIIKKMTAHEENKVKSKVQQRTLLEWKRDDFREVNAKLLALRESLLEMKMESTFNGKKVSSSSESIVTATAGPKAEQGSYYVKVKQMAQKVTMSSQSALGSNADLSSLAAQLNIDADAVISFTLAGKDKEIPFTFTAGSTKMSDVVRIINNENMGITATYDVNTDRFFLNTSGSGSDGVIKVKMDGITSSTGTVLTGTDGKPLSFLANYLKLNLNVTGLNEIAPASGRKITGDQALVIHDPSTITLNEMYKPGTAPAAIHFSLKGSTGTKAFTFSDLNITLQDMIGQINDARSDTGVTASYDANTGKVMFSTTGQVTVSGDTENFLRDKLNMTLGTWQTTIDSNTSVRVYNPANISMKDLYAAGAAPLSFSFNLEGGLGNKTFSFAPGTTTIQGMIDVINSDMNRAITGITASYDGDTGKISFSDSCPVAVLQAGSTATNASLTFNEPLYRSSDGTPAGTLTVLTSGQDLLSAVPPSFVYTGAGSLTSATYQSGNRIDFVLAGAVAGDTITFDNGTNAFFDGQGNEHVPVTMTFNGTTWEYNSRLNTDRKIAIHYDNEGFLGDELHMTMFNQEGQKAIIDFNDAENLEFDSNHIKLLNDTLVLDLKSVAPTQPVELNVSSDIDGAMTKIKAFIEVYNTTVLHMNTELTEKRYNDPKHNMNYPPLTAEQKKDMSEDEIKAWEAKAKSGMLRGETILFSAYSSVRQAATDPVKGLSADNIYTSLSAIGINSAKYIRNAVDGAKLSIDDEAKLRAALENDPEKVMELFTLNQPVLDEKGKPVKDWNGDTLFNKGLAYRLYDMLDTNMQIISNKAGSSKSSMDSSLISKEIGRINSSIKTMEERIKDITNRYYKQLTAMEKMISYYNSQSQWMASQVSQMTGGSQ